VLKSEPEPTREFPITVTVDGRVKVTSFCCSKPVLRLR